MENTMKAIVIEGGKIRFRDDVPRPVPRRNEALVRTQLAGICRTDLEIVRGYLGFQGIPGHEFVGVVEKCEDEKWVGERVVAEINCGCRTCETCGVGDFKHCPHRTVLGIEGRAGAFAEYVAVPIDNLHRVPECVSDDSAVFIEPLAAAFQVLEDVHIRPSERVAVFGDGRLGQLVARVLKCATCHVTVFGKHQDKLRLLAKQHIHTQIHDSSEAGNFDVAVECTGSKDGLAQAVGSVRPRGTVVLKTTISEPLTLFLADIVINEVRIVGSRCGPFVPAIRALAQKSVIVEDLISARFPLEEAEQAFEVAGRSSSLKVLLEP